MEPCLNGIFPSEAAGDLSQFYVDNGCTDAFVGLDDVGNPICARRNYFMFPEYACNDSFFGGKPTFDQWVGYVVVLAFGLLFGGFTVFLVWID